MPKVSIKVTKNRLPQIIAGLEARAEAGMEAVGRKLLGYADEEVPVRTGRLKESGDIGRVPGGVEVFYSEDYASMVHNGTVKQAPNPWLARAAERARPDFEAAVKDLAGWIEDGK